MLTFPPFLGPTDNSLPSLVLVKGAQRCHALTTFSNWFQGQVIWNTVALTGARLTLNLYLVYTPKLPPPPPREAHNRSELRFLFARRILPFASTISSSTRLSLIKPIVRWSGPIPPPAVIPPIPTEGLSPNGAIYPCLASLSTILPTRLPVPTTTVPHFLLSLMVLSPLTSITMPPLT